MNTEQATQKQIDYLETLSKRITARIEREESDAAQENQHAAYKARQFVLNYAIPIKLWKLVEFDFENLDKRQASMLIDAMKRSDNPAHFMEAVDQNDSLLPLIGEAARQFLLWLEENMEELRRDGVSEYAAVKRYESEQESASGKDQIATERQA